VRSTSPRERGPAEGTRTGVRSGVAYQSGVERVGKPGKPGDMDTKSWFVPVSAAPLSGTFRLLYKQSFNLKRRDLVSTITTHQVSTSALFGVGLGWGEALLGLGGNRAVARPVPDRKCPDS
jgi:hypothetical protein